MEECKFHVQYPTVFYLKFREKQICEFWSWHETLVLITLPLTKIIKRLLIVISLSKQRQYILLNQHDMKLSIIKKSYHCDNINPLKPCTLSPINNLLHTKSYYRGQDKFLNYEIEKRNRLENLFKPSCLNEAAP